MWVKICGNTNLEDAAKAAALGADAVGFVFAAGRRQVTPAQVAAITPHLPPRVERVGVFDSHDAKAIARVALEGGLTTVQLHGGLDERLIEDLAPRLAGKVAMIQTLHWAAGQGDGGAAGPARRLAEGLARVAAQGIVDRVLVDSKVGAAGGGTGVAFDWAGAGAVFRAAPSGVRLIVAGGLKPGIVAEAIAQMGPWGVDVASGVEAAPGRKDPALVAKFIANAHGSETP
jgi:phosphoribosylanthranilate isomerase